MLRGRHSNLRRPLLVGGVVGLLGAVGFLSGALGSWSDRATDRFFLSRAPDPSIVIVAIDDASITRIGRWPWDRKVHADLIRKLKDAGAAVIGYDVNFPEPQDEANDSALAQVIRDAGQVVLPIELSLVFKPSVITYDPQAVVVSISELAGAAAKTGHANPSPDTDGVVRRVPLQVRDPEGTSFVSAFAFEIARLAQRAPALESIPLDRLGRSLINFPGPARQTFKTVAAADVLQDGVDAAVFKDKIVLVGSTAPDLHDEQITPTSFGIPMPGVEIHASLLDTLLSRRWLRPVPPWSMSALLVALGLLMGFLIPMIRARWSGGIFLVLWLAILVASFLWFDRGWIIDIVWPTLVLGAGYAAVTLERRITAERERRELKAAFSRYVSASVVESILKDPSKLELGGERKEMTVLFSDIRGFTSISERLTPEHLVEVLNRYLNRMTEIVFAHEGVLDKYIGDAVMAFWNAPFDQPDHALRAVRTALAMRDVLDEMNASQSFGDFAPHSSGEGRMPLELRIGLGVNTGDMVVGNVGGKERFDYTVIGDNVNLASRLESLTKEYGAGILITEKTYKQVHQQVLARRLDKVAVKGKKEPVLIYEAVDLKSKATKEEKALVNDFEAALDAYFARDFAGAVKKCDEILARVVADGPTKLLRERAAHFIEEPPPSDWIGTWVYTKK